jgi:hypothetical protein
VTGVLRRYARRRRPPSVVRLPIATAAPWPSNGWAFNGAARELQFGGAVFRAGDIPSLGGVDLSPHLSAGATITFLACNAGQSPDLMRGIANAVRVPIRGFTTGVRWDLSYRGQPPHRVITRRVSPKVRCPRPRSVWRRVNHARTVREYPVLSTRKRSPAVTEADARSRGRIRT